MDDQLLLTCDEGGAFLGEYLPKTACHIGDGRRHLAVAVLLCNASGDVLLQYRKHQLFDSRWDLTGATHLLHRQDGTDETFGDAAQRCLWTEYRIPQIAVRKIGAFTYFAPEGAFCENEHCALMVGRYDAPFQLSAAVGYAYCWMPLATFRAKVTAQPSRYTPWALAALPLLVAAPAPAEDVPVDRCAS